MEITLVGFYTAIVPAVHVQIDVDPLYVKILLGLLHTDVDLSVPSSHNRPSIIIPMISSSI